MLLSKNRIKTDECGVGGKYIEGKIDNIQIHYRVAFLKHICQWKSLRKCI